MQAQGTSAAGPTVEIFVTKTTIDPNEEITAEKISLESWPSNRVPEGSTNNFEDLEGMYAIQKLFPGEPVMPAKLIDDAADSGRIPPDFEEVPMKADVGGAGAAYLQPGDRVNVTAYFSKSNLVPETTAKTILNSVRVYRVDGRTRRIAEDSDEELKPAKSIGLLVHRDDVEAWTYASELGKLRITKCNPLDFQPGVADGPSSASKEFLTWLRSGMEPAIENTAEQTVLRTPAAPKRNTFKTVKVSNGVMTEYTWTEGVSTPEIRVIGEESGSAAPVSDAPNDPMGLNGPSSPLYESNGEPVSAGAGQLEL